ncbi:GNAT family N-acetyltransferase [Acidocella sp.]|uniref:GNAT family N-acetyltransferase n=1 Tax=Acidocella sp. TaxID=50710 RepID=UPI0026152103|nr:GNAT family N-acetyltransferase [Acidocella sp.]
MPDILDYARPAPGEKTERAIVTVVFLRMARPPARPPAVLPPGASVAEERLGVAEYRALYDEVGAPWLWWLRRVMPDELLAKHLASPATAVHVLRVGGEVAGFFETDAGTWPNVNLNYFGLRPGFIGQGLGRPLLDHAVDTVFAGASPLRGMTVNTCNADHPRALPNYLAAGFREIRRAREEWDIPVRLGFTIPGHLRG